MELNSLTLVLKARKQRKRRGRGNASGAGKTSGRGHKGQMARSGGKVRSGFEGGQMPLYRRIPKIGFRSRKKVFGVNRYVIINLNILERCEEGATVDSELLRSLGHYASSVKSKAGIKVLGSGSLSKKLTVKVNAISSAARSAIEARGGTVEIVK